MKDKFPSLKERLKNSINSKLEALEQLERDSLLSEFGKKILSKSRKKRV